MIYGPAGVRPKEPQAQRAVIAPPSLSRGWGMRGVSLLLLATPGMELEVGRELRWGRRHFKEENFLIIKAVSVEFAASSGGELPGTRGVQIEKQHGEGKSPVSVIY